jgi:hypothetical protein
MLPLAAIEPEREGEGDREVVARCLRKELVIVCQRSPLVVADWGG